MKTIHAIWKNGQIVTTEPIDWPDGTTLSIEPIEVAGADGADEDLWGNDSASIDRWIAFFEAIPPMRMSAEEEAEWLAARRQMKEYTIAKMKNSFFEGQP
jgi:hypothetical protein